jgi:hypothetical protein
VLLCEYFIARARLVLSPHENGMSDCASALACCLCKTLECPIIHEAVKKSASSAIRENRLAVAELRQYRQSP